MQKYSSTVTDVNGNVVPTAQITVNTHGGGTATVYSDNVGTVRTQPFTPNSLGEFFFYAADGRYDVNASFGGQTYTDSDVILFDPAASTGSAGVGHLPAGTGAVATTVQKKLRLISVDVEDFDTTGTIGNGSVTDAASALQLAINYVYNQGGGEVHCMNPPYTVAAASGNVFTFPVDGTTMPYCVELKAGVKIRSSGTNENTFQGDWIYRTSPVNASQKIMFRLTDTPNGGSFYFEDVHFANCMIPIIHSGIISGYGKNISFSGCGICAITQQMERFEWHNISMDMGAGLINGGWLVPGGDQASGGWCDKSQITKISYIRSQAGWTSTENDIDTFFNTHFFNNAGLSDLVPYRGICGIAVYTVGRRGRPNFSSEIGHVFAYGTARPPVYAGIEYMMDIHDINIEVCGYTDSTKTSIMGVGTADPWNPARMNAAVQVYGNSGGSSFRGIYATGLAATDLVSTGLGFYTGLSGLAAGNPDLTNAIVGTAKVVSSGGIGLLSTTTSTGTVISKTLTDSETGSFIPAIIGSTSAGAGTYTIQVGRYLKINSWIFFTIILNWTAHTGTGNIRISNFPYASKNTANGFFSFAVYSTSLAMTAGNVIQAYISPNSSIADIEQVPTGGGSSVAIPMDTAAFLVITGMYESNA